MRTVRNIAAVVFFSVVFLLPSTPVRATSCGYGLIGCVNNLLVYGWLCEVDEFDSCQTADYFATPWCYNNFGLTGYLIDCWEPGPIAYIGCPDNWNGGHC